MGELVGWALAGPGGLVKTSRIVTCVSTLAHEKCHKNETQRVGRVFVTTQDLVVIKYFWGIDGSYHYIYIYISMNFCFWIPRFADPNIILCPMLPSG